jgi:hypothetical protein
MDATAVMPSMPALVNLEQQFVRGVAGILSAEAQLVSPISPPLASLLQRESQFVLSLLSQSTASSSTTPHAFPIGTNSNNIFPHPVASATAAATAAASSTNTTLPHVFPIGLNNNIFPHPF